MLLLADQFLISPLNNYTSLTSGSLNSSTDSKGKYLPLWVITISNRRERRSL